MTQTWEQFINTTFRDVEQGLHIKPFTNKKLLIKALTRRALLNEKIEFKEKFEGNGDQKGLDTLGDAVINLIITEEAYSRDIFTRKDLTDFWKKYGNNVTLHRFSNECLKLQDFIIWGPDEKTKFEERNKQPNTRFLAPCFEALIGAIYLDGGIDNVNDFLSENKFFEKIDQLK
jgi:ribonuclease III